MPNESNLWIPYHLRPARQRTKIVFYKYRFGDKVRIEVGAPEQFPAPPGVEKIVCESAAEVQKYSDIMRAQEKEDMELSEAERYAREEPVWRKLRQEMEDNLARAKAKHSVVNIQFCEEALRRMDIEEARRKEVRESWMHIEAHEQGH
jgi:hypothetical protein